MELTIYEEMQIRTESAKMGVELAFIKLGLVKDEISQREAYREFNEATVRSWVNRGLIKRIKPGELNSKATFSLRELETLRNLEEKRKLKK